MNTKRFSLFLLLALTVVPSANAVEAHLVTPDRTLADDITFDPGEPVTGYFHAGRSYECRIAQASIGSGDDYLYFSQSITGPTQNIQGTGVGGLYPAEAVIPSAASRQSLHRISFIAQETGVHNFSVNFDNAQTSDASVECFETSLSGSYNSFLASTPIVELVNRSLTDATATVLAIGQDGQTIDQETKIVPASSRADFILQVPPSTYGRIVVQYIGPHGSLAGAVSEYDYSPGPVLRRERPLRNTIIIP
jgi:hypothetical protein